jgi:serine/threonine-protein kinase HipA
VRWTNENQSLVGIACVRQVLPPGFEHSMIKFNSRIDQKGTGRIEYAYSLMASDAGVEIMPTHLFVKDWKQAFFDVNQ